MKKLENKYLKLANECADISGRIISKYFRKKIKIETKSDNSPVTKADKESEKKSFGCNIPNPILRNDFSKSDTFLKSLLMIS